MQSTRQRILDILQRRETATVEDLSEKLGLTPVTVRHHLDILRGDGMVKLMEIRRHPGPGRPQHVYTLTEAATKTFPNNYCGLATQVLDELKERFSVREVNVVFLELGQRIASESIAPPAEETWAERLDRVVSFLTLKGYDAAWENTERGLLLHTYNCPYHTIAGSHRELCAMDMTLMTRLLGVLPTCVCRLIEGGESCSYLIPIK